MTDDDLIVRALETAPAISAADDFTARVMARVPAQRRGSRIRTAAVAVRPSVGRAVVLAAVLVLFTTILLITPRSQGSLLWLLMQVLLLSELGGLLLWMSRPAGDA